MRRIIIVSVVLLCSACGAPDEAVDGSLVADAVVGFTANMSGLHMEEMPDSGCAGDALSPERVESIIADMSPEQQAAINEMLEMSSSFAKVELYQGDLGTGFCLPEKKKLLLLPAALQKSTNDLKAVMLEAGF